MRTISTLQSSSLVSQVKRTKVDVDYEEVIYYSLRICAHTCILHKICEGDSGPNGLS